MSTFFATKKLLLKATFAIVVKFHVTLTSEKVFFQLTDHQFVDSSPVNLRAGLVDQSDSESSLDPLLEEEHSTHFHGVAVVNCGRDVLTRGTQLTDLEVGHDVDLGVGMRSPAVCHCT